MGHPIGERVRGGVDLTRWRTDVEHRAAQRRGRAEWYESCTLHVAKVERSRGFGRAEVPSDPVVG
ncbi:hypothetical protein [Kitasatospora sp. NPDC094011]|uniref:hypothetical protein n=1 Tax=Kitasatospora sp. NPDC094011 TaxID=3364090 RepID=UPI003820D05E